MVRLVGVRKRYRRGPLVLDGADLVLEPGRPVVVNGANGSGKSTLLRIVAGCERPTAGRVHGRPAVVGYLPDRFPASARMPVAAYLRHLAALHRFPAPDAVAAAARLLGVLGFTGDLDGPVARLSKGNVQKVGLAQALGCDAGLLVLDEPWSGLDDTAAAALTTELAAAAAGGALIVVADHTGAAAGLDGAVVVRLEGGIPVASASPAPPSEVPSEVAVVRGDVGHPAGAGWMTVEVGWVGDVAEVVRALPAVTRWRPTERGLEVRLPEVDGDTWLAAALSHGCSVLAVRREPAGPS